MSEGDIGMNAKTSASTNANAVANAGKPSGEAANLASALGEAWRTGQTLQTVPAQWVPADAQSAFAVQHELLARQGWRIGGWKVGAKSADGPIQGAPLPEPACRRSGARFPRAAYAPLGLELEIAFRFGRTFAPRDEPYDAAEVLASIESMAAAIEIVASRFADWPRIDKFAQLADLQNHGALVAGEFVPYRADFPFVAPHARFRFGAEDIAKDIANPAGDPRRLLPWLVDHCTRARRVAITPETIVTTGSCTGMFFPARPGAARGEIDGLAPVELFIE
ncbi:2-keto-4-pentenoate hydratase [Paraburkholderia sp. J41]|uniref:2-keto-4-pentenoate hydratase n=1 Tax=Paraburkholderia sp. J41 TaxID=2805433 RepID=UPI002AC3493F|nr:2-keto-4-pentenoate hydratase [Paraburkholderia sp. J41]